MENWLDPTAVLNVVVKTKKIFTAPAGNQTPVVQPAA
jgi:hypothetical protein